MMNPTTHKAFFILTKKNISLAAENTSLTATLASG